MFGDIGGVAEVITIAFGSLVAGIAEHSFLVRLISKLYSAKTKDELLFTRKKNLKYVRRL